MQQKLGSASSAGFCAWVFAFATCLACVGAERVKAGKFANEPRKPFALEKWPAHLGFAELSQCSDSPAK